MKIKIVMTFLFLFFSTSAWTQCSWDNYVNDIKGSKVELSDFLRDAGFLVDELGKGIETHGEWNNPLGYNMAVQYNNDRLVSVLTTTPPSSISIDLAADTNQSSLKNLSTVLALKMTTGKMTYYKKTHSKNNINICVSFSDSNQVDITLQIIDKMEINGVATAVADCHRP